VKKTPIYTLTTIHLKEDSSFPGIFDTRCVGFFFDLGVARESVEWNDLDIYECGHYPYCVIEKVEPGLYSLGREEWWYAWDREREAYVPVEKPTRFKNICNFGIG